MKADGTVANGASKASDIDEDLHSRQLAVYGRESMRRMAASNVLIVGALGLGVEVGERHWPTELMPSMACLWRGISSIGNDHAAPAHVLTPQKTPLPCKELLAGASPQQH
jgi:hypothetical protein